MKRTKTESVKLIPVTIPCCIHVFVGLSAFFLYTFAAYNLFTYFHQTKKTEGTL